MSLKQQIRIRSVKNKTYTLTQTKAGKVYTADFARLPLAFKALNNAAKGLTLKIDGADIRKINDALREPREPIPMQTITKSKLTTE